MDEYLNKISSALERMLSCMPSLPASTAFVSVLNDTLLHALPESACILLEGRTLQVGVTDTGVRFDFVLRNGRFEALPDPAEAGLKISATFNDFYSMISGKTSSDTLFYGHRLLLNGDLDIGFAVKDLLAGMAFGAIPIDTLTQLWRAYTSDVDAEYTDQSRAAVDECSKLLRRLKEKSA